MRKAILYTILYGLLLGAIIVGLISVVARIGTWLGEKSVAQQDERPSEQSIGQLHYDLRDAPNPVIAIPVHGEPLGVNIGALGTNADALPGFTNENRAIGTMYVFERLDTLMGYDRENPIMWATQRLADGTKDDSRIWFGGDSLCWANKGAPNGVCVDGTAIAGVQTGMRYEYPTLYSGTTTDAAGLTSGSTEAVQTYNGTGATDSKNVEMVPSRRTGLLVTPEKIQIGVAGDDAAIAIDARTGGVTIGRGRSLDRASKDFWAKVAENFPAWRETTCGDLVTKEKCKVAAIHVGDKISDRMSLAFTEVVQKYVPEDSRAEAMMDFLLALKREDEE